MSREAAVASLRARPWDEADFVAPEAIFAVPGMLTGSEKRMLFHLAASYYSGRGAIADMGAFLGGSTICFAAGLAKQEMQNPVLHSYDLFRLGEFERERFFSEDPPHDLRTRAIFDAHLAAYADLLVVHEGDVLRHPWVDGPIELLFIDIAKSYKVFDHLVTSYFPALIPGASLVVLQDYLFGSGPWHHVVMERLAPYFEYVTDTHVNSVIFALKRELPVEVLEQCRWEAIPSEDKLALIDRAIEKLDSEDKRKFVRASRDILVQGWDKRRGMCYHDLDAGDASDGISGSDVSAGRA